MCPAPSAGAAPHGRSRPAQPKRAVVGLEDDRHAIVQLRHVIVGRCRHDGERAKRFAGRIPQVFPEPSEGQRRTIAAGDRVGPFPVGHTLIHSRKPHRSTGFRSWQFGAGLKSLRDLKPTFLRRCNLPWLSTQRREWVSRRMVLCCTRCLEPFRSR